MPSDIPDLRKFRERLRRNVARRYLAKCKKLLARYKGPGGAPRYKTLEQAQQARREYMKAYATVYAQTENGRRLRLKHDKERGKLKPSRHPTKPVAEFYEKTLTAKRIQCFYCKKWVPLHERTVDHYVPTSKGGKHEVENLRRACLQCNIAKGDKMPKEFRP